MKVSRGTSLQPFGLRLIKQPIHFGKLISHCYLATGILQDQIALLLLLVEVLSPNGTLLDAFISYNTVTKQTILNNTLDNHNALFQSGESDQIMLTGWLQASAYTIIMGKCH